MRSHLRLKTKILFFLANKAVVRFVAILPFIVLLFVLRGRVVDRTADKTVMCDSTAVVFDIATVTIYPHGRHEWKVYYLYQVRGLNYVGTYSRLKKPRASINIKVGDKICIKYSDKTPRYSYHLE